VVSGTDGTTGPGGRGTGRDRVIELADGRRLGYTEFGDPTGYPVVNCHGGLVCRLDVASADAAARRAGVRIVSPDRPGVGLSCRQAGRRVGDWPADAAVLADQLGLGHFSVFGWSMGGPYAVACVAHLSDRVDAAAVVAGGVPLDWPCTGGSFGNRTDDAMLDLARRRPDAARTLIQASRGLVEQAPDVWMEASRRTMTAGDVAALERDGVEAYLQAVSEGLADPDGVVDEYLAYAEPWGFRYEDVARPVRLWQGSDDPLVPPSWSEEAAGRLPQSTLTLVPGAGHLVARDHWAAILADLLEAAGVG
jgi:pimeloyl-ACP methyl ester carboxylesterase